MRERHSFQAWLAVSMSCPSTHASHAGRQQPSREEPLWPRSEEWRWVHTHASACRELSPEARSTPSGGHEVVCWEREKKEGEPLTIFPKSKATWFHRPQKIQVSKHPICCHQPVSRICTHAHYFKSQSIPPDRVPLKTDSAYNPSDRQHRDRSG